MNKRIFIALALFFVFAILPGVILAQTWCFTFNKNLGTADSGVLSMDVPYLHLALFSEGISYDPDGLLDYSYGTIAAVTAFQEKYASEVLAPWGLTQGTGFFGTTTRAKMNQLYGCGSSSSSNPNCAVNWQCTNWGNCYNNQQIRICTDYNFCGTNFNKPTETQSCTSSTCTPNWQCTSWSACYNGQQTKICTDYNFCGTTSGKPATSQSCTSSNNNNNNNTNTCQATCRTQSDGIYAISCSGSVTKCSSNQICEQTYSTSYDYSNGYVQTIQTLTGSRCTYSSSTNNNNNTNNTCTEDWDCGDWGSCSNYQQTKTCTDLNHCGTTTNKPATSQYCCEPSWSCGFWSDCVNKQQTRSCVDANSCGTTTGKPATSQYCCTPDWDCGDWGVCSAYGQQTKICTDTNNCGTTEGKPETTQSCTCTENWQCGTWGACYNSQQTRFCYDTNHCGTTTNKLYTTQSCTSTCSPNYVCSQQPACKNNQIQSYCYDLNACFSLSDFRYCAQ